MATLPSDTPYDKRSIIQTIQDMPSQDKLDTLVAVTKPLDARDKEIVADQAGLGHLKPVGPKVSDTLWFMIVLSFVIVLLGTFLSIAYGVLVLQKAMADVGLQVLLTLFTSAVAFLAGVLTPAPASS